MKASPHTLSSRFPKMNSPTSLDLLINRLEAKCDTLTRAVDFHNATLKHHQAQYDVITRNMNTRREMRDKAMERQRITKERLESLKRARHSIDSI